MRAIIIGAGRGSRLRPYTDDRPKCLVAVGGRPILDWISAALSEAGVTEVVFVGGYRMADIQRHLSQATFVENTQWQDNNILASLLYAEEFMDDGFVCCYSDTIITRALVEPLMRTRADIAMALDTSWNERHTARPNVYDSHVEGTWVDGDRVTRIERIIPPGSALGEFTGVMRFSSAGATAFRRAYHAARAEHGDDGAFGHASQFRKAYLVDLLQLMINAGTHIGFTATPRAYLEIDTVEDYELANSEWVAQLDR